MSKELEIKFEDKTLVAVTPRAVNAMRSQGNLTFYRDYPKNVSPLSNEVFMDEVNRYLMFGGSDVITHKKDSILIKTVDDDGE